MQFYNQILKLYDRDLRAALEVSVARVYNLAIRSDIPTDTDYTSDCEDTPSVICNQALTAAVRKGLAVALANLMEHGLMHVGLVCDLCTVRFECVFCLKFCYFIPDGP